LVKQTADNDLQQMTKNKRTVGDSRPVSDDESDESDAANASGANANANGKGKSSEPVKL
jgi:hypothetical protein